MALNVYDAEPGPRLSIANSEASLQINPSTQHYRVLGKKGEGTFAEVLSCKNVANGCLVAVKRMKNPVKNLHEVESQREIQALKQLRGSPHIVQLREVCFDEQQKELCLVFDMMNENLYECLKRRGAPMGEAEARRYMYSTMKALEFMHSRGIFHRDVKPENILLRGKTAKLADLGSVRETNVQGPLTEYISTRWYRAPECLLSSGQYGAKMDIWAVGCVLFEILTLKPLFPGSNEVDQLNKIHRVVGTPDQDTIRRLCAGRSLKCSFTNYPKRNLADIIGPKISGEAVDLMDKMLVYDPSDRLTASEAVNHRWFAEVRNRDQRAQALQYARQVLNQEQAMSITQNTSHASAAQRQKMMDTYAAASIGCGGGNLVPLAVIQTQKRLAERRKREAQRRKAEEEKRRAAKEPKKPVMRSSFVPLATLWSQG
eukprot:Clim_evm22s136 gene=Clim_evmTU22s136